MNEQDYLIVFIVFLGVGIGLRRGLVRVLISTVGIYFTVVVTGYVYKPIGDMVSAAFDRLGIELGITEAHNITYVVGVIAMTVVVELVSRSTFEETRIVSLRGADTLLGAVAGVFYGALWASLFLVPGQYSVAQSSGMWSAAVYESTLVPTLNKVFKAAVLDVVSILFVKGTPRLYLNPVSQRVSYLFFNCS